MYTPRKAAAPATAAVTTPKANTSSAATPAESPGTWRHPRVSEISRRVVASTFSENNIRRIAYNFGALAILWAMALFLRKYTSAPKMFVMTLDSHPPKPSEMADAVITHRIPTSWKGYIKYAYIAAQLIPVFNIALAMLPLFQKQDDLTDIPLTPSQRKLLGLRSSSAESGANAGYSTPPRYSRSPSISGSVGSRNNYSASPLSGRGSPAPPPSAKPAFPPSPASPLLAQAVNGSSARQSSFESPSPLGVSTSSMFFPDSPTPNPAGAAKRSSIGLNNKWLYDRGRRSSGQNWYL